jgi:hypothetical protein
VVPDGEEGPGGVVTEPVLFHFSEDPTIALFEPRRESRSGAAYDEAYVWAIDEWHAPMYYLPRDCPRACFWPQDATTAADRERWFSGIAARMVIAVETGWLERIRETTLFRYRMPAPGFVLHDATAGHWVSREPVAPLAVEPVGELIAAIVDAGVELRITPLITDLWLQLIETSLAWSGTRLRNALQRA